MSSHGSAVPKARIISAMSSWESNFSANSVEIYILAASQAGTGRGQHRHSARRGLCTGAAVSERGNRLNLNPLGWIKPSRSSS